MLTVVSFASSAYKGDIKFKQKDGSTFTGNLKGDEWFSWIEDSSGHIIKYNNKSKNYEYGEIKEINGLLELVPSGSKVSNDSSTLNSPASSSSMGIDKSVLLEIWKRKRVEAKIDK
jgi:hypothetical protein